MHDLYRDISCNHAIIRCYVTCVYLDGLGRGVPLFPFVQRAQKWVLSFG